MHGARTQADKDKPKVSKNIAKPLQAAKEAMDEKKYAGGLAKLKEVRGAARPRRRTTNT